MRPLGCALVIVLAVAAGCGSDEGSGDVTSTGAGPPEGAPPLGSERELTFSDSRFERCRVDPNQGGGTDVVVVGIDCAPALDWIRRLGSRPPEGPATVHGYEAGWECWSKLERQGGPVHNICVRDSELISFYFH